MLSPARWMTASKPETVAGAIGFAGSQETCSSVVAAPRVPSRTMRTTSYPRVLSEGRSAAPIGPETPLTRIREIMADPIATVSAGGVINQTRDGFDGFEMCEA